VGCFAEIDSGQQFTPDARIASRPSVGTRSVQPQHQGQEVLRRLPKAVVFAEPPGMVVQGVNEQSAEETASQLVDQCGFFQGLPFL
jgi:hypothetical protein